MKKIIKNLITVLVVLTMLVLPLEHTFALSVKENSYQESNDESKKNSTSNTSTSAYESNLNKLKEGLNEKGKSKEEQEKSETKTSYNKSNIINRIATNDNTFNKVKYYVGLFYGNKTPYPTNSYESSNNKVSYENENNGGINNKTSYATESSDRTNNKVSYASDDYKSVNNKVSYAIENFEKSEGKVNNKVSYASDDYKSVNNKVSYAIENFEKSEDKVNNKVSYAIENFEKSEDKVNNKVSYATENLNKNVKNKVSYAEENFKESDKKVSSCKNKPYPSDIDGHWAEIYIRRLYDLCVVEGYEGGFFRPNANVTRAELVKMGLFANGIEPNLGCYDNDCGSPFDDLDPWQGKWVRPAYDRGIIEGYVYNMFMPNEAITRAEAVKVVLATYGYTPINSTKSFFNDVEGWSVGWIERARVIGLVQGIGNGNFDPNRPITRAEASKVIAKMIEYWDTNVDKDNKNKGN